MRADRLSPVRGGILALVIGVLAGCSTPSVDAGLPPYDPTALTAGLVYHWPVGTDIAIHVAPGPSAADDRLAAGTRSAISHWPAVLGYREHTLRLVDSPAGADIIVRDSRVPAPVDAGCAGSGWTDATAAAVFCPLGDTARTLPLLIGGPGRTKVLITVDVVASAARVAGLDPVVLHEIGHALGIGGHSAVSTDAMFPTPGVRSPSLRDALTLRYVLHRRPDLTL